MSVSLRTYFVTCCAILFTGGYGVYAGVALPRRPDPPKIISVQPVADSTTVAITFSWEPAVEGQYTFFIQACPNKGMSATGGEVDPRTHIFTPTAAPPFSATCVLGCATVPNIGVQTREDRAMSPVATVPVSSGQMACKKK
jgi:hypothetical protein